MDAGLKEEIIHGYKVTEKMKRLWAVELDLLERFIDVCSRNGLRFYASYGTLLGAVRHRGFIPWDDDIDLTMPRKDLERLKLIADKEFKHPYFFQTSENDPEFFWGGICRLRNSNTTQTDFLSLGRNCNQGCFIDITALDGIFDDERKRKKQVNKIEFYKSLLFAKTYRDSFRTLLGYSPAEWRRYMLLAKRASRRQLYEEFIKACSACDIENTSHLAIFTQKTGDYEFRYFDKDIFENTIMLDFEHLKIPVPSEYSRFIETVWDKGIELPPEDERRPRHTALVDTERSYKEYNLYNYTDAFKNIGGRKILLFGAGRMFDYYMERHGRKYRPHLVFDNDKSKWGTVRNGVPVRNPDELQSFPPEDVRIIITNIYFAQVADQLKSMGIKEFYVYLQGRRYR